MDTVPRANANANANATDATFTCGNPDVVELLPEQRKRFTTTRKQVPLTDEEKKQAWSEIENLWQTYIEPHLEGTNHDVKSKPPQTDLFGHSPQAFLDHLKACSVKCSTETQLPEDPISQSHKEA